MSSITCLRKSLCCINLFFWIMSCGLIGIGIWLHIAYRGNAEEILSNGMLSGDGILINAGFLSFLIAFSGCCGTWFQNKCLLKSYFTLLICILLVEFVLGSVGFVFRKRVGDALQKELLIGMQDRYSIDNRNGLKETWDTIQEQFKCCGVRNYQDWHHISAWSNKEWVPSSCCLPKFANISSCGEMEDASYIYSSGCYPKIHMWLMDRMHIVGIITMVVACIQLFGVIATLIIICSMGPKKR